MAVGSLLAGPMARADTGATPVHIAYTVPSGCPGEAAFLEMVASDGTATVPAPADQPAQSFEITVEASSPVTGRLRMRRPDGTESERAITGPHCEEVVRSLAVIFALAVAPGGDPPIVSKPTDIVSKLTNSATEAETKGGPSVPLGPESDAWDLSPTPWPAPAERVGRPDEARRRAEELRPRWRAAFSVETGGGAGPSRALGWTFGFYGEVLHDTPDAFAPSLRLGGEWTKFGTGGLIVDSLDKAVARVDACPWRALSSPPLDDDTFSAQLCARGDVGWVDASYSQGGGLKDRLPWAATGALLRVRWLFPVLFMEAEAGVEFPITHYRFLAPSGTDFEVPDIVGMFGLGGGFLLL
jgi:hypothetical protein